MSELVENIASILNVTPAQLANDIWAVAQLIDDNQNHGYAIAELEPAVKVYMLKQEARTILDGIMFESFDGPRSRRYSTGWMVRKNPNWRLTWQLRFGEYDPDRIPLVEKWLSDQEAAKAREEAKPKRKDDYFADGRFEDLTSIQVAHRAAVADVLSRRYREMRWERSANIVGGIWRYKARVWQREYEAMIGELHYRLEARPETRRSKKKQREAEEDFLKAKDLLAAGTGYFFSAHYITMAIYSETEPDLNVDFEHLPRQPLDQTPVRWQRDDEVITSFMSFLDETHDPGSFEYEDQELILTTLRKMLARAKGQKPSDEEMKIGSEV